MKKSIWSKILKVLVAAATAIIGVLGGTNVHDS
ncbi:smalltalk protein [uncultured Bacteroides sp.]|nr:smalltalk protein [uncultured Bacteroides sp.]